MQQPEQQIQIKADDATLKGVYANFMQVGHSREEFVLDFVNIYPPVGSLNSRVIVSPGHLKRIVSALEENLKLYEQTYGEIAAATMPKRMIGFKTN
jgi:hypothetical protein